MPDKDSLANQIIQQAMGSQKSVGYNPSLTSEQINSQADNILNKALSGGYSTALGEADTPSFRPNPEFNTTDVSMINKDMEASDSWWKNTYHDFMQSYYTTQLNTLQGKAEAGDALLPMPWSKLEGPQAILDLYPDRIADLDKDLNEGRIDSAQYSESRRNLEEQKSQAESKLQEYQSQYGDLQSKINDHQVSKKFKLEQARVNSLGDAASTWDRIYYGTGNTLGSSASLMLPNFLATFGNKAAQNIMKLGLVNAIPELGQAADVVATGAALLGTVGETIWSRGQETYAEIAEPIAQTRARLTKDYMEKNNIRDEKDVPEEVQRQIRIQSRQGMEQQFRENMMLAVGDLASATLLPFSNVGYGLGKYAKSAGKFLNAAEQLGEEAKFYGKFAHYAGRIGKGYAAMQLEGFEEGLQFAAQDRALGADKFAMTKEERERYNSWTNTINYAMQDGYDTISSIDMVPGQSWSNLGGKYADNNEFQASTFGGQFLGTLMSGPLNVFAMAKDMQRFKAANADLQKSGVLDVDGKFQALRNSVLEKYFKNGRVGYLAGALRDLKNAKDEDGNSLVDPTEIEQTAKDIKSAYELYQDINDHVDERVGRDKLFGLFDSKELAVAKDKLRSDIFNAATNITMHTNALTELDQQINAQKSKDGVFAIQDAIDHRTDLEAQLEAAKNALAFHEGRVAQVSQFQEQHWVNKLTSHIETLKNKVQVLTKELDGIDKTNMTPPSAALTALYESRQATELYLKDAKEKYAELGGIRTRQQLKDYVGKNMQRPVPPKSDMAPKAEPAPVVAEEPAPIAAPTNEAPTSAPVSAPEAAVTSSDDTQVSTPPVDADPGLEAIRKMNQKSLRKILTAGTSAAQMGKALSSAFAQAGYVEQGTPLDIADVFYEMRDYLFADDPAFVRDNFNTLQNALAAVSKQPNVILDPRAMELVEPSEEGPVPSVQAGQWADDLNGKLNEVIREAQWEPGTGNKIVNSVSIAQLNTRNEFSYFIDEKVHGDYRDDEGSLDFSEQSDQQLNNTKAVSVGDKLTLQLDPGVFNFNMEAKKQAIERKRIAELAEANKVDTRAKTNEQIANADIIEAERQEKIREINERFNREIAELDQSASAGIDKTIDTDANYDQAIIGVYKTITFRVGGNNVSRTVRLGSLHRLSKLREIMAPTVNLEDEIKKLRELRKAVIQSGEATVTVASKGFGYLNTKSEKTTIATAVGKDSRPYLSVVDNTGRPIALRGTKSIEIQGAGLKAGAAVLMVPNNDVYVPIYVTKNTISSDKAIHQMVFDSVSKYLADGAQKHLQAVDDAGTFGAEAFIYKTTLPKTVADMTPASGVYVHYVKSVPAITIGGNTFTADNATGLREALGSIYVNVNRKLVSGTHAAKYTSLLKASPALSTNIQANPVLLQRYESGDYAFLQDGEQYSYFSQHTISMAEDVVPKPVTVEQVEELAFEPTTADEKADALLEELGLSLDVDDLFDGADDLTGDEEGIRQRLLVSPEIPVSLQHQMIDSLAYMLLSNKSDKTMSNVEKIRQDMAKYQKAYELKANTATSEEVKRTAESIGARYALLNKNFDELIKRAKAVLSNLGIEEREENDYYENFEDLGESEGYRDNSEQSSTRNQKDYLPQDVRKLLYFLPELIGLDMNRPGDVKIAKETGKNYKVAKNSLGLDSFNNFNDTWEKLLGVTSSTRFSSTQEGYDAMIKKLQDPSNAPIVQELAEKLAKAPDQLKNAFFRNVYMQNQKNVSLMYTLKTITEWKDRVKQAFTKRTAFLIRSDRRSAEKKIMQDMYNEFKANRSGILSIVEDPETGRETYVINTEFAKSILADAQAIAADDKSYKTYKKREKGVEREEAGNYFTDEAKIALYGLVRKSGLNITFGAFKDTINYGTRSLSRAEGERAIFKDLFLDKYFHTLAGNREESDQGTPFEKNNPFKHDRSVLEAIALQEYKYRTLRRSGAYRLDGKSYYAYTRHNMLSELFLQLHRGSDFVLNKLKFDDFARRSRILNMINDPEQEDFHKNLELFYELGAKNRSTDNPTKLLKDMTPREHTIMRIAAYQNDGKAAAGFMYDTLSDKTTKPIVQMLRMSVAGYKVSPKGYIYLSDNTLDNLMNYYDAEYDRIKQVEIENGQFNSPENGQQWKIIKNYHDVLDKNGAVKKMGMGKFFHIYYFLNKAFLDVDNKALSNLIYNADGTLKERTPEAARGIKAEINKHFNKLFVKNKADFEAMELFNVKINPDGSFNDNIQSFIDHNYLTKKYGVLYNLGVSPDKQAAKLLDEGRYGDVLGPQLLNDVVNYAVIDYVVNSAMFSNEMLMLTGDPAQAGKPMSNDELKPIRDMYKDKPSELAKWELLGHIQNTFVNLGKRNAAFLASGEKGMFDNAQYNVAIANDIAINSTHLEDYVRMFPDNVSGVTKAYAKGDLTDAQEVTTVEEHLHVMKAFGKISDATYRKALYHFDHRAYSFLYPGSGETLSDEERKEIDALVMQPMKPVQRTFTNEEDMRMSKQYYIKTSSYPLIPALVKGTPLEALVDDMRAKGVHRVAFGSGVKQGIAGSKDLFETVKDAEGNTYEVYNSKFLENNQNILNRDGFRIQLEVPYKATKDHIREGTQQSKLMFVDIPQDVQVAFQGNTTSVGDVQKAYIEYHKRIVDNQTKMLMEEIANPDGSINMKKLSKILQDEGEGRGYAMNSLLGLDLNSRGQFKIPLTFLPNAGQMEPVITSIVSNRVSRLKMPGKSYVQGSEFMLRRGEIKEGTDLDKRGIIWTKPEYQNMNKLSYLHVDANGEHHNSQIIMPFYFIKDGKKLRAEDFVKTVEHNGKQITVLDTDRIDPELLQMNGFRIPYQGHNSGMWFEIVGFLPEAAGDLVLVPGEIAGQMGSDYDVDKLYSYMYNYVHKEEYERLGANAEEWEMLKRKVALKLADINAQKDETGRYSSEDYKSALYAVVEEEYADKGLPVPKHKILKSGSEKYEISKIHEDDPRSTEALQNAIIDAQKAIYTSPDPGIMKAILDPLSFKDVEEAIDLLGSEGTSTFMGAFDPVYQRDTYFSNVTGKLATAICANANTSHAMAQSSNLFIKGQGVLIYDENGSAYADRTGNGDDNRVNGYSDSQYQYIVKSKEGDKLIDQNDGTHPSAWRLDKVFTFPDPVTGTVYRISNLISQLLGVSVDNAKEQKLGAFGINKENLNVVLTIVRAGFSLNVAKAFVNQPILKEYYEAIGDAEDIFEIDFTSNKRDKIMTDLYQKYGKMAGLEPGAISALADRADIQGFKFSELRDSLNGEASAANVLQQLEVFKAYQRYKQISDGLATLTGTFGIDVKGLPKNMAETAKKAEDIEKILRDNDVLGGVSRYADNTIPGLFLGIPSLAVDLFMNERNPLFVYASAAYTAAKEDIMTLAGKTALFTDQIDTVHNHIKQYIYSGFRFPDNADINAERRRLLFDTPTSESLQTRLGALVAKYPKNELLASIIMETSTNPANPKLLSIESSNEDDYVQKIQEYWENMLKDDTHPDLMTFAQDMLKYAMWVQPQEFGPSNIVRYMPIVPLIEMGFSDYLNGVNLMMNIEHSTDGYAPHVKAALDQISGGEEGLQGFARQFLQHNPEFLISAREDHFTAQKTDWTTRQEEAFDKDSGNTYMRTLRVSLNKFTLPAIPTDSKEFAKNKAAGLVRNGEYPRFLKFYTKEVDVQVYEGVKNTDGTYTYYRIERLGSTNVSEYSLGQTASTLIDDNIPAAERPATAPVQNAMAAAGSVGTNEGVDYIDLKDVNDMLGGLITSANKILTSNAKDSDKAYARYFIYLATQLQGSGLSNVRIILNNDLGIAGRTSADGRVVTFSPRYFKQLLNGERKGRSGLSPELEKQRTVLHELLHAQVFQALHAGRGTEEFKKIREVHAEFRKALRTNEVIRGVDVSALDAELFSLLKDMFDQGRADDLSTNFVDFIQNQVGDEAKLRQLFEEVGKRLEALAAKGELADKNYDLVSDQQRYSQFAEHVRRSFARNEVAGLINKYYAYHNIDEFITEAMTNAKVQDVLRGIPSVWKTFVNSLKDLIAKLLGIETEERTLFDDALDSVFAFMRAGKPVEKTELQKMNKEEVTHPYPGVENIPDTGLTIEQANKFIDLLQPQIRNQAYVENKARTANRMFSFGLRWAKNVPNEGERSKQNANGPGNQRPGKVNINSYNDYTYGYYKTDQNNNVLPSMQELKPIMDFVQSKLKIDLSDYDSMLANIYESNSFIHQHRDITESRSAGNYPVVVINLGADGGLLFDKATSDKELTSRDAYAAFEKAMEQGPMFNDRIGVLPIKNGGVYAFGVNGVNRFTFNHRIVEGIGKTPTKPIVVPEFDAQGNKVGEKTLTDYRITLTFRRAQDITPGSKPARVSTPVVTKTEPVAPTPQVTTRPTFTFPDGHTIEIPFANGLSKEQEALMNDLYNWWDGLSKTGLDPERNIFLVKGYAGTGKTSVIKFFLQYLSESGKMGRVNGSANFALSAPSHQARKQLFRSVRNMQVKDKFTGKPKFLVPQTDARKFFKERTFTTQAAFQTTFSLNRNGGMGFNQDKGVKGGYVRLIRGGMPQVGLWIIDEVSMVADASEVAKVQDYSTKIPVIIMGDPMQLRNVESRKMSPLFSPDNVSKSVELKEVQRQTGGNPLITELTNLRNNSTSVGSPLSYRTQVNQNGDGVVYLKAGNDRVKEMFQSQAYKDNRLYVKVVAKSNDKVAQYNRTVRGLLGLDDGRFAFSPGDTLMGYAQPIEMFYNSQEYVVNEVKIEPIKLVDMISKTALNAVKAELDPLTAASIRKGRDKVVEFLKVIGQEELSMVPYHLNVTEADSVFEPSKMDMFVFDMKDPSHVEQFNAVAPLFDLIYKRIAEVKEEQKKYPDGPARTTFWKERVEPFESALKVLSVTLQTNEDIYRYNDKMMSETQINNEARKQMVEKGVNDYDQVRRYVDLIKKKASRFKEKSIDYGYAITAYKSQGATYENTIVDLDNIEGKDHFWRKESKDNLNEIANLNSEIYVAMSRSSKSTFGISQYAKDGTTVDNENSVPLQRQMIIKGDIWNTSMIPVIPTNLGGIHGAGLAQAAAQRGLVEKGKGEFSANTSRVTFPVKKVWSDATDMDVFKDSMKKLFMLARKNPDKRFALPLVGLGHGEGDINAIVPLLALAVKNNPNITLVIPGEGVNLGRPGTVRQDNTRQNMPEILAALAKAGVMLAPEGGVDDLTADDIITDLISRGLLKTKCK